MSAKRLSSQRMVMSPEAFFERYIAEDLETNLIHHRLEEVCRQYLVRRNRAGRMPETSLEIGKYWCDYPATHENGEFDIVTPDARGLRILRGKVSLDSRRGEDDGGGDCTGEANRHRRPCVRLPLALGI